MRKKSIPNIILLFPLFLLSLNGCEGSLEDEKRAANEAQIERFLSNNNLEHTKVDGIYHVIQDKGFGHHVHPGDSIAFWYIGYTLNGIVFDTNILDIALETNLDISVRNFNPVKTVAGNSNLIEGLNRGLLLCREGELATLLFSSIFGFGDKTIGPLNPWSPLAYDIFIIYVNNKEIEEEKNNIINFVASNEGFNLDTLGFWYRYLNQTQGRHKPRLNDTIYGWYKGATLQGLEFVELPSDGEEIALRYDEQTEGLIHGFMLLYPDEAIEIVVPSCMAYGREGYDFIEPYTPIIYQVRLDSIK